MTAIIDCRVPAASLSRLQKLGFEVIHMPRTDYLAEPVSAHPDMLVFGGFDKLFCHVGYYQGNKDIIDKIADISGLELVVSAEPTSAEYPCDVLFNCVLLGDRLLCNKHAVSKLILAEATSQKLEIIHTNQGYTKCSVCKVDDNAIITSDKSIYKACVEHNIDALLVSADGVGLRGYDCGFIGGASGGDGKNIYFCGDISLHPDGDKIVEFCKAHGKNVISLSDEGLYDVGSILFI